MTNSTIYDQRDRAMANISAFIVLDYKGNVKARIQIAHRAAVTAWIAFDGAPLVKGRAAGGGYDRTTAAIENAMMNVRPNEYDTDGTVKLIVDTMLDPANEGKHWDRRLRDIGFNVIQAV